ncbi:MAG: hypothetical protein K0B11_13550, partial [Mariniphaga sp.]|nr:hypothetical protein [Mariniphaga sp.]
HWQKGYVKGLKARGNFEVDIRWENGILTEASIKGREGSQGTVNTGAGTREFQIPRNGVFTIKN